MKSITITISATTLKRLNKEARDSGRSVEGIIRERLERQPDADDSVYIRSRDLAGRLSGTRDSATNDRRKFTKRQH